ncbi:MAG: hypothetical protein KF887_07210 [Paracoccaceae bacterium]|nr:MAG: hypothetical protein KF887_07210 [Paracoccaceae bacterium]
MTTAPQILQHYLDEVGAAVLRQDWPAYRARVTLPFHLVTHTANLTVTDEQDLRLGFDTFAETLRIQKITDYMRLVEGADFLDDILLNGRYITHMMAGGHRVLPPFRSQITLRFEDGRWRGASISNALANSRWPIVVPALSPTPDPKGSPDA